MSINVLLHHYKIHTKTKKTRFTVRGLIDRPDFIKEYERKKKQMEFHYQGSLFICSTKSARYAACREHIKWRNTANRVNCTDADEGRAPAAHIPTNANNMRNASDISLAVFFSGASQKYEH